MKRKTKPTRKIQDYIDSEGLKLRAVYEYFEFWQPHVDVPSSSFNNSCLDSQNRDKIKFYTDSKF